ncbi:EamA family transporter [Flavihumibacter fluvii]|uniref:EamA family transporter n=1 Tax=Flavihumibacter fluvii TaxID=2838157 RepID=UPI001BDDFA8F|nr:EamA family transporter [Flavihumibacter fluvii]ULQ52943.1 EamA family transporter [Flavihumibacter fluvii]
MLFLLGSILLSSYLTLSFKVVERLGINTFQAIVYNYFTCVIAGILLNGSSPFQPGLLALSWFPWALLMGFLFISLFNIIGYTAQKNGVSVASVANKLSLVIPFIFSVFLYNEKAGALKILGLVLALLAVVWVSQPDNTVKAPKKWVISLPLLPLVLFVGSGLLDTLIKYVENRFLDGSNNNDFLVTAFAAAACMGLVILVVQLFSGKAGLSWQAFAAGVAIGVPNYFSIWCLVNVLKEYAGNSSAIIPVNNMGIVALSTLVAAVLFQEKLSRKNWLGIILSLAAIALIAFG